MADGEQVVDYLGDDHVRTILVQTCEGPKSVDALSDACGVDPSTIYRRVQRLQEADLLEEQQKLDPGGHHHKVYVARVQEVRIRFETEGIDVAIEREEESPADRFTRLYEGFK